MIKLKSFAIVGVAALGLGLSACCHQTPPPPPPAPKATIPPKYLSVHHWKHCVTTQSKANYNSYCLPKVKPCHCPKHSWHLLNHHQMLPHCH